MTAGFIGLDSTKGLDSEEVHQHDLMREFRLIVKNIAFTTILGNDSDGKYIVEAHA